MNNRKGGRKGSKRGKESRAMPPAPPDCCYLPFRIVARTRRRRQRFPVNKVIMLDAIKSGNIILVLKSIRRSSLLSSSEGIVNGERRGDKQKQEQKKREEGEKIVKGGVGSSVMPSTSSACYLSFKWKIGKKSGWGSVFPANQVIIMNAEVCKQNVIPVLDE